MVVDLDYDHASSSVLKEMDLHLVHVRRVEDRRVQEGKVVEDHIGHCHHREEADHIHREVVVVDLDIHIHRVQYSLEGDIPSSCYYHYHQQHQVVVVMVGVSS